MYMSAQVDAVPKVPSAHGVHTVAALPEYLPGLQSLHFVAAFLSSSALPLSHSSHWLIPTASDTRPAWVNQVVEMKPGERGWEECKKRIDGAAERKLD